MWLIIIIGVIVFIIVKAGRSKSSAVASSRSNSTSDSRHFPDQGSDLPYVTYVQRCYAITTGLFDPGHACPESVLVMIQKIDSTYCSVYFKIEVCSFMPSNITFGQCYKLLSDGVSFDGRATGFTTPQQVRDEILLQMGSSIPELGITVKEATIIEHGDYTGTPFVSCRFDCYRK